MLHHRSLPWHNAIGQPSQDQTSKLCERKLQGGQSYCAAVVVGVSPGIRCLCGHRISHRWVGARVTDDGQSALSPNMMRTKHTLPCSWH